MDRRAVVVGAGHNGLVAACYLARAGWLVTVLERQEWIGGATSTVERLPHYRFDTHSVAHNLINMTDIVQDLDLAECGLEYQEMDPFSTMLTPDGKAVRFYRDLDRTCEDVARLDPAEARRYRQFIRRVDPLIQASTSLLRQGSPSELLHALPGVARWLRGSGPWGAMGELFGSYGRLLDACCESEWMKAALAALAAHATVGPDTPGGAFYAMWQAAYHRYGMWRPRGGSGGLAEALAARLQSYGGRIVCGASVIGLEVRDDGVVGVSTSGDGTEWLARASAGGEPPVAAPAEQRLHGSGGADWYPADAVVTTVNPRTVLLDWLPRQAIGMDLRRHIAAARTSNAVQFVVHVAVDRLPAYRGTEGMTDAWNGMAAMTRSVAQVSRAFKQAELGLIPDDPPAYIFTPSVLDSSLCPAGRHTVYLACPASPGRLEEGSWAEHGQAFAERLIEVAEGCAPGFRGSILDARPYTPAEMEEAAGLVRGHPMHLALLQDQLLLMRPIPELGRHRTPVRGLYLSGAGTAPSGGVLGIPGRRAARAVLRDFH